MIGKLQLNDCEAALAAEPEPPNPPPCPPAIKKIIELLLN